MYGYVNPEVLKQMSTLTIYRLLIKHLKEYPSMNKHSIKLAAMETFRDNRKLQGQEAKTERTKAEIALRHVCYYIDKNASIRTSSYHNIDYIEPFAKKKEDNIYF